MILFQRTSIINIPTIQLPPIILNGSSGEDEMKIVVYFILSLLLILCAIAGAVTGCSSSKEINVLKPAEFQAISVAVNPTSIMVGQEATVLASIKNVGDISDTLPVSLRIDDGVVTSKTLTLEAGAIESVSFIVTPNSTGIKNINVLGANCTLKVISMNQSLQENGLCYGAFRDGQSPEYKVFPSVEQIEEDLQFIKQITSNIRTYGTAGTLISIPKIAKKLGMTVTHGIDLGNDTLENEAEISRAIELANQGLIDSVIVGNESLTLSRLPKDDLVSYIRRVKSALPPNIPVSTAEFWDVWRDTPDLIREVDFVVAHFYPYWENHGIDGAALRVIEEYQELQAKIKEEYPERKIEIVIGETGWPTIEPWPTHKVPKPEGWDGKSQRTFIEEFIRLACNYSIKYYYFEVFDEEWKWREGSSSTGEYTALPQDREFSGRYIGSSWGIYQSNGYLKQNLTGLFPQPDPASRLQRDIFTNGQLATYYDIGVDSSANRHDWLYTEGDSLRMDYPANQSWGVVFITVGTPVDENRPWKDFSRFGTLTFDLRGANGDESLEIGIKDYNDADDGGEKKVTFDNIGKAWQSIRIPVTEFASPRFVITGSLGRLYVIIEFVSSGPEAQTIFVRNVRYTPPY